jgi:hypothetical protein
VEDIPEQLGEWMTVNPRVPRLNKKEELVGPVGRAMVATLSEEPEKFALKNQGMYILAKELHYEKEEGGGGVVTVVLEDPQLHGLVNGGHTYRAIRQVADDDEARPDPWEAYVRLHLMEGVDEDLITDLAEGLNRSLQVDNPSLENLKGTFDKIKDQLKGASGEQEIAYRQGDPGNVDILQVLTFMAMFDLNRYPGRKEHPNGLFGHPKAVLDRFIEDSESKQSVFDQVLPRLHEILVLSDWIQQRGAKHEALARVKVVDSKKQNRVRSPKHRGRPAFFAGGTIDGMFPLGWLYPMLAAFRANVDPQEWKKGKLSWLMDPDDLLNAVIDEMADIVKQEHLDNNRKPADVGKKEAAYRGCYSVVTVELAQRGLLS